MMGSSARWVSFPGQAERAADTWTTLHTDFYPPPVVAAAMRVIAPLAGVAGLPWGGYNGAERARILLAREEVVEGLASNPDQVLPVGASPH